MEKKFENGLKTAHIGSLLLRTPNVLDMRLHLVNRHLDTSLYSGISIDDAERVVTFPLWNLSGQFVGYQAYRPDATKVKKNDEKGRYYTYRSGDKKNRMLACWGLETYNCRHPCIFLSEGIFDACRFHNYRLPAIALLSNDPKQFRSWLRTLPQIKIAICDNDDAGKKLAKLGDFVFYTDTHDCGDMTETEFQTFLNRTIEVVNETK